MGPSAAALVPWALGYWDGLGGSRVAWESGRGGPRYSHIEVQMWGGPVSVGIDIHAQTPAVIIKKVVVGWIFVGDRPV